MGKQQNMRHTTHRMMMQSYTTSPETADSSLTTPHECEPTIPLTHSEASTDLHNKLAMPIP